MYHEWFWVLRIIKTPEAQHPQHAPASSCAILSSSAATLCCAAASADCSCCERRCSSWWSCCSSSRTRRNMMSWSWMGTECWFGNRKWCWGWYGSWSRGVTAWKWVLDVLSGGMKTHRKAPWMQVGRLSWRGYNNLVAVGSQFERGAIEAIQLDLWAKTRPTIAKITCIWPRCDLNGTFFRGSHSFGTCSMLETSHQTIICLKRHKQYPGKI